MEKINGSKKFTETQFITPYDEHEPLVLECGKTLSPVTVAYETYGRLNNDGTNAVLICHALTANAHAAGYHSSDDQSPGWWDGLIGPRRAFDTKKYFVICPNILGSCYGTTGPSSLDPKTGEPHRLAFPPFTIRDIVAVQKKLLDALGVNRLAAVCGSSLGGMQVLEWGISHPDFCETIIPISTAAKQSAWCIGLNTAARAAIMSDPVWNDGFYTQQPIRGLATARMVGMLSYRSAMELERRFGRHRQNGATDRFDCDNLFQVESYLHHQGEKLGKRFDANTYIYLSRAMDLHDVTYGRAPLPEVLGGIKARTLCIGVSSDIRYPIVEQKELVNFTPDAQYAEIDSIHGHDAFLIEFDQLNA
ncbi:MAG: homoserine O-acetyltransferase MetX, partial [bacterium]